MAAFRETVRALGLEAVESVGADVSDVLTPSDSLWMEAPRGPRPTAAVCWNDMTAYDLPGHCQSRGLRVPEDLAVTGYDGIAPPPGFSLRLTTVRAPWMEVARTAVDLPVELVLGDLT